MSVWKTLLETAVRAPSPHNVQPWRVRILSEQRAELLIEKHRTLPKEDPTGSFIILTMGLFIEALRVLAANRSLDLTFELFQPPEHFTPTHIAQAKTDLLPFASLSLASQPASDQDPTPTFADSLFYARRTSRITLLAKPIPTAAERSLAQLAATWGQTYKQVTSPELIERILERNIEALFEDLNAPAYHDEIVEWFRFTERSSSKTRDGLDYRCMNSSPVSFWLAARIPRLLKTPGAGRILKRIYRRQLGNVPTIGMLAGPFWEPASAFETGRFLLHFWLETAQSNLYIHPYGNLVTNRPAAEWCREALGIADIWLIFKIGFSAEPPLSQRRTVEEVLVD